MWQITASAAATSYGVIRILPALSPAATVRLRRDVLVPVVPTRRLDSAARAD